MATVRDLVTDVERSMALEREAVAPDHPEDPDGSPIELSEARA